MDFSDLIASVFERNTVLPALAVRTAIHPPSSFIRWLILTDSPLSVIWWQALCSLTSCWVALLCTKTVKIILWALYLEPTLKSYSLSALSLVRSAWLGKGLEQNTLTSWATCFRYTLRTTQTLRIYSLNVWGRTFKGHDWATLWNVLLWFAPRFTPSTTKVLMVCHLATLNIYTGKWLYWKRFSNTHTRKPSHLVHACRCAETQCKSKTWKTENPRKHAFKSSFKYIHIRGKRARAHARSSTRAHSDTCSNLLSLLLFFCFAFHVQSLVCDSCLSAEDRRREHNLCDGERWRKRKRGGRTNERQGENS